MELEKEQKHLMKIQEEYQMLKNKYDIKIKECIKNFKKNPLLYGDLVDQYKSKIALLNRTIDNPFFGRIDFLHSKDNDLSICYLGKVGVLDEFGNPITVDWRAPIATLYYDSNLGDTSYMSPGGLESGMLKLKRQYTYDKKTIVDYQDVNAVTNDNILKTYLSASKDNRLKNIVSTIQKEQNAIIRNSINDNIIVQGSAGSGKTTVALHRIAYLIYNEKKRFKENAFLVIGPNNYFLKYISDVLPDLDVNDAHQYTFLDIVNDILKEKIKIKDQNDELELVMKGKDTNEICYKSSLEYKDALEEYINLEEEKVVHGPIKLMNFILFNESDINKFLNKKEMGIVEKVNEFIKYAKSYVKKYEDNYKNNFWHKYRDEYLNCVDESRKKEILDITEEFNKNIKNIDKLLKDYFKDILLKPLNVYYNFISRNDIECINKDNLLNNIRKKVLGYDDLAALLYINMRYYGVKKINCYAHVVLDEAQDLGLFSFYVLKNCFKNATFSIFGDLAQGIYSYQGINNWDEVIRDVFGGNCNLLYLDKSYRTTVEIMDCANKVSKLYGFGNAKNYLRHGDDVKFSNNTLESELNILKEKNYKNIAIICKDMDKVKVLSNKLNIGVNDDIFIVTSYLSKGLEFEAVIIENINDYDKNNMLDMKLLYVSMTRALHELVVIG